MRWWIKSEGMKWNYWKRDTGAEKGQERFQEKTDKVQGINESKG